MQAVRWSRLFLAIVFTSTFSLAGPRVISTSPEVTELLFQLGHGNDLVATSAFSNYPDAAKRIPELGPLYSPSIERTIALKPDWVILDEANLSPAYERALFSSGVRSIKVRFTSADEIFAESSRLLDLIYAEKKSPALERAKRCFDSLPKRARQETFLAFVWLSPPTLAGHTTFLSDLIERTGGTNALPKSWRLPYPNVSEEWLLEHPVDSVYFLADASDAEAVARKMAARWWPGRKVRLVALRSQAFARASFTPFSYVRELDPTLGPTGEDCPRAK